MEFSVTFSSAEKNLLNSLIGKTINSVQIPGSVYSIRLLIDDKVFDFTPEEFSTPEEGNSLTDVTRPFVSNDHSQVRFDETKIIAHNLGAVESIKVLHTNVFFSSREPVEEPTVIAGVEIPITHAWGYILMHPHNSDLDIIRQHPEKALVSLDIGILIETSDGHSLCIHTDGCGYCVYGKIDSGFPEELEGKIVILSLFS